MPGRRDGVVELADEFGHAPAPGLVLDPSKMRVDRVEANASRQGIIPRCHSGAQRLGERGLGFGQTEEDAQYPDAPRAAAGWIADEDGRYGRRLLVAPAEGAHRNNVVRRPGRPRHRKIGCSHADFAAAQPTRRMKGRRKAAARVSRREIDDEPSNLLMNRQQ